jgi:hypothetical protein
MVKSLRWEHFVHGIHVLWRAMPFTLPELCGLLGFYWSYPATAKLAIDQVMFWTIMWLKYGYHGYP